MAGSPRIGRARPPAFSDVAGLSFAVGTGENWTAEIVLHAISGSSGQGFKFRRGGAGTRNGSPERHLPPLVPGTAAAAIMGTGTSSSTASECEVQTGLAVASPAKTFVSGANLTGVVRIHITLVNASAGTVQLQASNSSGGGTVTLKANSDLVARRTG
jgi:hypothetical protein